jgi:hypothetical protein
MRQGQLPGGALLAKRRHPLVAGPGRVVPDDFACKKAEAVLKSSLLPNQEASPLLNFLVDPIESASNIVSASPYGGGWCGYEGTIVGQ